MAILVRRLFRIGLCIGLLVFSVRYIPRSNEWTLAETRTWVRASDWLGVENPDDLYLAVWLAIELIVAGLAYLAIINLWRLYRRKNVTRKDAE
ncbi:hypothetical protein BTH42_13655 [Burkholderia sp. SRS-W-2-2016]|uniref:hypothetical protein n=1 Tax=Burkholderia sp. SRS-W-2-2016 TaxID=1926878 RepID=UPI00094AF789|nr:hypothetical protein [Burkholderia sp. SRS-W-2-2016]OLL31236.1 hypothetical protein BTH42_13655 [Burkholderia sp. SRS-W-2-2016]